jgi:hypothetical protein
MAIVLRSCVMSSFPSNPTPQFATAEYAGSGDRCKSCNQAISGSYYRVNGAMACENCATQLKNQLPKDSHSAFMRALAFGAGAAIVGLIGYAAFAIITGITIGYVALAVGWLIGKAMHKGSNGMRGRRYQIAAAALTYAAVSMAAIPIYLSQSSKHKTSSPAHVQSSPSSPGSTSADPIDEGSDVNPPTAKAPAAKPAMNPFAALGLLALVGLASPFLELQSPIHGAIGLLILFVGMRFAWQQAAAPQVDILGPFRSNAPST